MTDCGIVFMTAASRQEAQEIAKRLLEKRLAACVQILPEIQSIYRWQGKICDDTEILLTAKTTKELFAQLVEEVKMLHSYDVPEIIFTAIQDGSPEYMSWLRQVTKAWPDENL